MGYFFRFEATPAAPDGSTVVASPRRYKPSSGTSVLQGVPCRFGGGTRSGEEWVCLEGFESVFVLPHAAPGYERIAGLIGACMGRRSVRLTVRLDDWVVLDAVPDTEHAALR